MPRKAKEKIEEIKEKNEKKEAISKKNATKKISSVKEKKVAKTTEKKSTSKPKKTPSKEVKKAEPAKAKKEAKKTSNKVVKTASKKNNKKKIEIVEYYDLPYRYNQTVVKILAQTPNTLFVYWDISDEDRKKYTQQYGEYFFHNTKPVLIVYNKTKNYNFEVDINDFANSWYLRLMDSDCDYQIELGRRPINKYVNISNNYLYITTSNKIESPNDRILFDHLNNNVYFRNVKTNYTIKKEIVNLSLLKKIGNISKIKDFYKELYPDEEINSEKLNFSNPSSK